MFQSRTLLTVLLALFALIGRGALEYVAYDLANPKEMHEQVAAADVANLAYRTGSTMLFVRDTSLADPVYIGVYEVTQAQAYTLGWSTEPTAENAEVAYGFNGTFGGFTANHKLDNFPLLSFPTGVQWEAYAGEPKRPCNVSSGIDDDVPGPVSLSHWYIYSQRLSLKAPHGAFNMYGNVAEFVSEGTFRGGYAIGTCTYDSDLKSWAETTISAVDGFGMMGARLVYTPPEAITYQAIVTLDGETVGEPIRATPGTQVTLMPPTPTKGYRLQGPVVTPEELAYVGTTFEMPDANVTFAYTSQPYATLQVDGGTASAREVFAGDTVTLTPTPSAYQLFSQWTLPDGSTSTDNPLSYTVTTITPGETLTFTAAFQTYPRVLIYGGTASAPEGSGLGEGFYKPGTELTLTPNVPADYAFDNWTTEDGKALLNNTYTVGDYGSTVTITANFKITEATSSSVTYIGEADPAAEIKTMKTALGYESSTATEWTTGANTFRYFPYTLSTADYATLNLADGKTVEYPSVFSNTATKNKSTLLPLKRVTADGSTYYLGIYETTEAHVEYIKRLANASYARDEKKETSYIPHEVRSLAEAKDYLASLNATFPMSATLPSREQIVNITKAYCTDKAYKDGAGHLNAAETYGDPTITEAMMWFNHSAEGLTIVGSMTVDPYGFYDLWGNANELWSDGNLWGGSFSETRLNNCNAEVSDGTISALNNSLYPSFRPLAVVTKTLAVTVSVDNQQLSTTVLPGQVIKLAPQVKTGYDFTGWTAKTASGTKTVAKSGSSYPYTVTEAVTLTASFKAKAPLTVSYENCLGPTSVLPGATMTLYAATPTGEAPTEVTIAPVSAATWNADTGTLTFSASASGSVTVTATYPEPTPPKPGYKVYLQ